jgi:putative transposase
MEEMINCWLNYYSLLLYYNHNELALRDRRRREGAWSRRDNAAPMGSARSFGSRAYAVGPTSLHLAKLRGMVAHRKLARAIGDMGFFEFRRQLEYKAKMRGAKVVVVDRFFPSSKVCSDCGFHAGEMKLDVRHWTCTNCGESHDRDLNAARNLRNAAASPAVTVCGAGGSGARRSPCVKLPVKEAETRLRSIVSYS